MVLFAAVIPQYNPSPLASLLLLRGEKSLHSGIALSVSLSLSGAQWDALLGWFLGGGLSEGPPMAPPSSQPLSFRGALFQCQTERRMWHSVCVCICVISSHQHRQAPFLTILLFLLSYQAIYGTGKKNLCFIILLTFKKKTLV